MLTPAKRTGRARIAAVLVHGTILASGLAGLATFAVTMSEANPASPDAVAVVQEAHGEIQSRPEPAMDVTPSRPVRVVYPGR